MIHKLITVVSLALFWLSPTVFSFPLHVALSVAHRRRSLQRMASDAILDEYFGSSGSEPRTILGFGSLLSITSSRLTFPNLKNFRPVRVKDMRRVFSHPAGIFFERGIADLGAKTMASLSTEQHPGSSFLAVAFEVEDVSTEAFLIREEEFDFRLAEYEEIGSREDETVRHSPVETKRGMLCTRSTDEVYLKRWGEERFRDRYERHGITTIWDWSVPESGIKPCSIYLRHCYLAASAFHGVDMLTSFLDETVLVDRKTTVRTYMELNPWILDLVPPASLIGRYSG